METLTVPQEDQKAACDTLHLHDHNLVHELSLRLNALCRYAQCIAGSEGDDEMIETWRDLEAQELENVRRLKQMIAHRVEKGEFLEDF